MARYHVREIGSEMFIFGGISYGTQFGDHIPKIGETIRISADRYEIVQIVYEHEPYPAAIINEVVTNVKAILEVTRI